MEDFTDRNKSELNQKQILNKLFKQTNLDDFEKFRNFPVFTPRFNMARFLAHYEIFKKIYKLPGVIIDLGVYRGASSFTWAKLCEIFCPTDVKKKIFAFDTFKGFPNLNENDIEKKELDIKKGGYNCGKNILSDLELAQEAMNQDKFINHINRIEFIKGNVINTIPKFCKENNIKIALLNLDLDLYEPTKIALENFEPLMVKNSIIILDEYADNNFIGETKAVDEYFKKKYSSKPNLQKFFWHSNPSAYIKIK